MDDEQRLIKLIKEAGIDKVQAIMSTLSSEVRNAVLDILDDKITDAKKAQAMRIVRNNATGADAAIREWTKEGMGKSYIAGFNTADAQLAGMGFSTRANLMDFKTLEAVPEFGQHKQAVNQLMRDAYLDFGNGINGVVKNAEQRLNDAVRQQIRVGIAEGRELGSSIPKIADNVKASLSNQGFTALVDRGGSKWSLESYSEMLTRTHVIKSNNEAQMNRYLDYGVTTVEVSSHGATDSLCAPEEGEVYSLTASGKYPFLNQPPPFHPNCFDKETEIYTDKGWQYIKDVDTEDTALSLNPDTLDLEMVEIKNTIEATADKMVSIKNKYMNMLVTPGHDVFYKTDWKHKNDGAFTFVKAEDLVGKKSGTFYASSKWVGEETISEEEAEFMGWYLSEGYVSKVKDSYIIGITQSKEKNPEKFAMALEAVEAFTDKNLCVDDNSIRFYDKELGKELVR
jgi:hypothetical protein